MNDNDRSPVVEWEVVDGLWIARNDELGMWASANTRQEALDALAELEAEWEATL